MQVGIDPAPAAAWVDHSNLQENEGKALVVAEFAGNLCEGVASAVGQA